MQKLAGTSSGKNNKSCRIFHHESNQIGFAFFWFFYDFLRSFQDPANDMHYLSYRFAVRPPEFFAGSQIGLYLARNPLELTGASQCGPWGVGRRGSGQIPASRRPGSAEREREAACGLLGTGSQAWLEERSCRWVDTPAARRRWPSRLPTPARGGSVGEVGTSASFSRWDIGGERLS
jgi:hypothetical protein